MSNTLDPPPRRSGRPKGAKNKPKAARVVERLLRSHQNPVRAGHPMRRNVIFSEDQVAHIKRAIQDGMSTRDIRHVFGVPSSSHVGAIRRGDIWADVAPSPLATPAAPDGTKASPSTRWR